MYERVQGVVSRHSTTPQQQQEAPNGPKTPSNKPPRIDAELTPVQYNPPEVIFVGQVGLGTPLQNFRLAFEIGSADTWVALENVNCKDPEPCSPKRQVFYPQRSSTFDPAPNKHWEVRLSDKSKVEGWLHTDVLQVAEFAISHQVIGMATAMTGFKDMGADGTFALGLSSLAARAGDATPIENLITANGMKSEVGIWLGSGKQGGELIFGGNDPESFKGDLSYFDLPNKSVYWAIPAASISVDEAVASAETETGTPGTTTTTPSSSKIKQINRLGQDSKLPNVIFDTSSNLILLPPRVATRLHRYIQNHIFGLYTGYNLFIKAFTVPCNLN
ncbi:aspartic peptidase domain-containing protein, partial [Dissophora ornata]